MSIPKRRGARSRNTLSSHFYEVLHLIVLLFLLLLVVVDHLALIELHANSVVVTTVEAIVTLVTEATAFDLVALAFAVVSAGEVFTTILNKLRACNVIRRRITECHFTSLVDSDNLAGVVRNLEVTNWPL
jgi:di/tricarboxylate transporter